MRTIPAAMTWEILVRSRWTFLLAMLGSLAMPVLLLTALRRDGFVNLNDKSMLILQMILLQMGMFSFGAMLYGAQGKMSRLYAYPARTSELVAWRLVPMMVFMVLEMVLAIGLLDWIFGIQWPVWGPAVFGAVEVAATMPVVWLTEKSVGWTVVGLSPVGASLGLWFRSRYGQTFSDPTHTWAPLTAGEVLIMLAIIVGSYGVGVWAVARNRRGEPPVSIGLMDWLDRTFNPAAAAEVRLKSPYQAQCWLEWRRKGWPMPMGAISLIVFGTIGWFLGSRRADDLFTVFFAGGQASLWVLAFVGGLILGNEGANESNFTIGHFMGTRPISDSDIGRAILRTAIKSLLLTWSIWLAAMLIACGCLMACGASDVIKLPKDWSWWYFPSALFGPWIIVGGFTSIFLLGRSRILVPLACAIPAALFVIAVGSKFFLSLEAQFVMDRTLVAMTATGLVMIGVWVYAAARRRGLIQSATLWAAATIWIASTAVLAFQLPQPASPRWLAVLLIAAMMALIVGPVASVPLALSANRHR